MPNLLEGIRSHLVTQGIVRSPRVAGGLPPLWLAPQYGVPEPGLNRENLHPDESHATTQVGLWRATGLGSRPYEGALEHFFAEFRFRTTTAPLAYDIHKLIRTALDDKRNWSCGGFQVHQSLLWRDLQFLGSDPQGYVHQSEYHFVLWA
jgi:hypothetical protein